MSKIIHKIAHWFGLYRCTQQEGLARGYGYVFYKCNTCGANSAEESFLERKLASYQDNKEILPN